MPEGFSEIGVAEEIPVGQFRTFTVEDRRIVVYHLSHGFYATDHGCPHRGGPLGEGDLIGDEIVCPWHLWSFNVTTGLNPGSPPGGEIRVATHQVRVAEDGVLWVKLSSDEETL